MRTTLGDIQRDVAVADAGIGAVAGGTAGVLAGLGMLAIPGIVLGVGLFLSYTRPPLVLYGTLWILLLAFLTIVVPMTSAGDPSEPAPPTAMM